MRALDFESTLKIRERVWPSELNIQTRSPKGFHIFLLLQQKESCL